jgi:signal transduction histidine kinase
MRTRTPSAALRTSTFRHAATVAGLVVLAGIAVVAAVLLVVVLIERHQADVVRDEAASLQAIYQAGGSAALIAEIDQRAHRDDPTTAWGVLTPDPIYVLAAPGADTVLAGNLPQWPLAMEHMTREEVRFVAVRPEIDPEAFNLIRAFAIILPDGHRLMVGRDVDTLRAIETVLEAAPIWLVVFGLISGLLAGWVASHRILGRIDAIGSDAERIMAGDLSHRMPLSGRNDEFDRLALTLNRMLSAIETLMRTIRAVTDDIAHDLRTPLTRARHGLERALASGQIEPMRAAVADAAIEIDELVATFNAMLTIASAESDSAHAGFETLTPAALARDLEDLYRPMAEDKRQELTVSADPRAVVAANRQLLFQALANLLENAIKYTPEGGSIAVDVTSNADAVTITVADNGPGIAAADRGRVLERFVRLDASRSQPGNGLGLALVAAVAKLHAARLVLEDNQPGLRVTMVLEAQAASRPSGASPAPTRKPLATNSVGAGLAPPGHQRLTPPA